MTHTQYSQGQGPSGQKTKDSGNRQTDGQTWPSAVASRLTRSVGNNDAVDSASSWTSVCVCVCVCVLTVASCST